MIGRTLEQDKKKGGTRNSKRREGGSSGKFRGIVQKSVAKQLTKNMQEIHNAVVSKETGWTKSDSYEKAGKIQERKTEATIKTPNEGRIEERNPRGWIRLWQRPPTGALEATGDKGQSWL